MNNKNKYKLAIIAKHFIQYHVPIYKALASSDLIDAEVLFLDSAGLDIQFDPNMNANLQWGEDIAQGYKFILINNWQKKKNLHKFFISRINPGIVKLLKRKRYDGVLIQGYDTLSNLLAFYSAKIAGLDIFFRGEVVLKEENYKNTFCEKFKKILLKQILSSSNIVFYSCTGNKKCFDYYGCSDKKMILFPCAVDNTFFRKQRDIVKDLVVELREELDIGKNDFVVLTVSRFEERKRQIDTIKALELLDKKGYKIKAFFIGDGPSKKNTERYVVENDIKNIIFTGFKDQNELAKYYELADVFVLGSTYDPSPKAVNEALNFELPIVASDKPGTIGDMIVDGYNAIVYPACNIEKLAAALEGLYNSPLKKQGMGHNSLVLSDKWSIEADVEALEQAVKRIRNGYKNR